jgi:hypothetical protein
MGEVFVRRRLCDAVLKAFADLYDDTGKTPDDHDVVITVKVPVGEIRALRDTIVRVDLSSMRTQSGD